MNRIEERAAYTRRSEDYIELIKRFTATDLSDAGNYTIGEEIGSGAFGKIYIGYHKFLNSKVCLKRGNREIDDSDNMMREFYYLKEFGHHPNVGKLYELIFSEKSVFLVMEYYADGDLFEYLSKRGSIPTDEALKLFTQLVGAVYYIHRNGCCHRDLKLENVLLDSHYNAKLSDFGFTREVPLGSQGGVRGLLTEVCGTTAYMAPELVRSEAYSGVKTDMWALGVMLYTMVRGQMPFDDSLSEQKLEEAVLHSEPDYPFTPELTELLKWLLSKSPENRPNSLDEVLRLPLLQTYGGESQIETVDKLLEHPTKELSALERALLKDLIRLGFDRTRLKQSVLHEQYDSLDGFWRLLKEKEMQKLARKHKHRSHSMLRLSSFDTSRVKAFTQSVVGGSDAGDITDIQEETHSSPPVVSAVSSVTATTTKTSGHKRTLSLINFFKGKGLYKDANSSKDSLLRKIFTNTNDSTQTPASTASTAVEPPTHDEPKRLPSTFSTNSDTSGVSAPVRPNLARGISDLSIGSRNVSSQADSPNSSITGLSRNDSFDSSTSTRRRPSRKSKTDTRWNFGVTDNSLKRYRQIAPRQIIEEEEDSEDADREDE